MPTAVGTLALAAAATGALNAPTPSVSTTLASDVAVQPLPGLDDVVTPVTVLAVDAARAAGVEGGSVRPIGRVTAPVSETSLGDEQVAAAEEATRVNRIVAKRKEAAERAARARRARELAEQRARERAEALARRWVVPTTGYRITATFGSSGRMWSSTHTGTDFAAPSGTPVYAAASGTVIFAGWDGPYGNKVEIRHADGTVTWYAHMSAIYVSPGEIVAGDTIGAVGATGNVTGPHLHFEVRPGGGEPVNSLSWLREQGADV